MNERVKLTEEMLLFGWVQSNIAKPPKPEAGAANLKVQSGYVATVSKLRFPERDAMIEAYVNEGLRPCEIVAKTGLTMGVVTGVVTRLRVAKDRVNKGVWVSDHVERNAQIIAYSQEGWSCPDIMELMGLTKGQVEGVLRRHFGPVGRYKPRSCPEASIRP